MASEKITAMIEEVKTLTGRCCCSRRRRCSR